MMSCPLRKFPGW